MPGKLLTFTWRYDPTAYGPPRYRKACRYEAFLPVPLAELLPLTLDTTVAGLVSEAEGAIRELNAVPRTALRPLSRLLLRTESIASSRIEGIQVGVRDLARAEAKVESGEKIGAEAGEILANVEAMELAIHDAAQARPFTVERITAIHGRLLARSAHGHIAGRIRTSQNWIGGNNYNPCGAAFVPPPPELVGGLLEDLCAVVEDDTISPVIQAALVHAQFETIHPFADGNGRTGRALIHVILRRRGIAPAYVPPISLIFSRHRDRYIHGLTRFHGEDVAGWIDHFAAAAADSATLATRYLEVVHELQEQWRARLSGSASRPRADAAAWTLIDELPAHPMITLPIAAAAIQRSPQQVNAALGQLEGAGVLRRASSGQRNRRWEPTGLLDLIESLEEGRLR